MTVQRQITMEHQSLRITDGKNELLMFKQGEQWVLQLKEQEFTVDEPKRKYACLNMALGEAELAALRGLVRSAQ